MHTKLLLFDLDDTLLTSEKTITINSIEAIQACKKRGMLIGYITARAKPSKIKNKDFFINRYNLPCDFIAYYNGAEICVGNTLGTSIVSNVILYDDVMKMIQGLLKNYPNIGITIHLEPWSFKNITNEIWNNETGEIIKCTVFELPRHDVQRIRIVFDKYINFQLDEFMTDETIYFITNDGSAIIVNKNALKERALLKASEYFNIPLPDIIAFGDDINDIEMLKIAGTGVAMGNASEKVKEAADCVTETNDNDGVAIWINGYFGIIE